jgi:SAM-dependent methyltransferase
MKLSDINTAYQQERIKILQSIYPATTLRRVAIRAFVEKAALRWISKGPILDIGCGYRSSEPEVCSERLMPYYTLDKDKSKGADFIIDAHSLYNFNGEIFEALLLIEVLEHVEFPYIVLQEAKRILRKNGIMLVTVPCLGVPLHPKASYGDFRRFSPDSIKRLMESCQLEIAEFEFVGTIHEPYSIHIVATKR